MNEILYVSKIKGYKRGFSRREEAASAKIVPGLVTTCFPATRSAQTRWTIWIRGALAGCFSNRISGSSVSKVPTLRPVLGCSHPSLQSREM